MIRRERKSAEVAVDLTPMIDMTFILLIFFMVTASFTLQKSLHVPVPKLDEASATVVDPEEDDSDRVTVQVDAFNTYHVITVDWEEEAPSVQDLLRYLRQARDGDSKAQRETTRHSHGSTPPFARHPLAPKADTRPFNSTDVSRPESTSTQLLQPRHVPR